MKKLAVMLHSFYFNDGTWVKWTPIENEGKAHGLFNVTIEFPPTERGSDIVRSQHRGPATAHASLHLLKWAKKDRSNQ